MKKGQPEAEAWHCICDASNTCEFGGFEWVDNRLKFLRDDNDEDNYYWVADVSEGNPRRLVCALVHRYCT